jgi:hypothetical protein
MASAASDGPQSVPAPVLAIEALGSVLLCASAFTIVRVIGTATVETDPSHAAIRAVTIGVLAFAVAMVLGRLSSTMFSPNGAFGGLVDDRIAHDDVVGLIIAQFAGAAVVGLVFGAADRQPIDSTPEIWSLANLGELIAACALALAARTADRTAPLWTALVIAIAAIAGVRFLGNPALLIGDAFAGTTKEAGMKIGAPLTAQTLGLVIGAALPRFNGLGAVADRPS